jgi:hypothetical protein
MHGLSARISSNILCSMWRSSLETSLAWRTVAMKMFMSPSAAFASWGCRWTAEQKNLTATGHHICAANTAAAGKFSI